jgi:hypothetical protein
VAAVARAMWPAARREGRSDRDAPVSTTLLRLRTFSSANRGWWRRFPRATRISLARPPVSKCAESAHLSRDCFRDLGAHRRDVSYGDVAVGPIQDRYRPRRAFEFAREEPATSLGERLLRLGEGARAVRDKALPKVVAKQASAGWVPAGKAQGAQQRGRSRADEPCDELRSSSPVDPFVAKLSRVTRRVGACRSTNASARSRPRRSRLSSLPRAEMWVRSAVLAADTSDSVGGLVRHFGDGRGDPSP